MELNQDNDYLQIFKFIRKLAIKPLDFARSLLDNSENLPKLVQLFKELQLIFEDSCIHTKTILINSDNFLLLLVGMLDWEIVSVTSDIYLLLFGVLSNCYENHPERFKTLEEMGIVMALLEILKKEKETQFSVCVKHEIYSNISTQTLIAYFLPIQPHIDPYLQLNDLECGMLYRGRPCTIDGDDDMITHSLEILFPTVYDICQMPVTLYRDHVLLLKIIFWANYLKVLTNLVDIKDIINYVKYLLSLRDHIFVTTGLAIIQTLSDDYLNIFQREKMCQSLNNVEPTIKQSLLSDVRSSWIRDMYAALVKHWVDVEIDKLNQENRLSMIREQLFLIISYQNDSLICFEKNQVYENLVMRMGNLLKVSKFINYNEHPKLEGITDFRCLVIAIVGVFDEIQIDNGFLIYTPDLYDVETFMKKPQSPNDIQLGLFQLPSIDRVLGPSKSPDDLKENPLVQILRLLSILFEVNENWGVLFGILTTDRLIERSCFVSKILEKVVLKVFEGMAEGNYNFPKPLKCIAEEYPFLLPLYIRHQLFRLEVLDNLNRGEECFENNRTLELSVPRHNVVEHVAKQLRDYDIQANTVWSFEFIGEEGRGIGTTKEFYSEFSRDCQRYDLDLWIGEPCESYNGVVYSISPLGSFPKPIMPSSNSGLLLDAIGQVMAKSILDDHRMNLNMNNSFYKCLLRSSDGLQCLTLVDLKYVMPSIFNFVSILVNVLKEKKDIERNESLSIQERMNILSNLTFEGSSFEDLCINFTLPGFPLIEMVEGGNGKLLAVENVEEYLQLLVWWFLYMGPQISLSLICRGFERYLPNFYMQIFYPDEIEEILCGASNFLWTKEYLKRHCVLADDLTLESPVVQYLFEVLSSFSASEQRQFLQFVTSTPRLPHGGLKSLLPRLTVKCEAFDGDPDMRLPYSRTCFNLLVITRYSSKDALREKLLLAITEGVDSFQYA